MTKLTELVLAMDLSAVDMAKAQGAAAVPELVPLLDHEDGAVRTVAVLALGGIDHPIASEALGGAVSNEDHAVAVAALDQLEARGDSPRLLSLLDRAQSGPVARRLVLAVGRSPNPQVAGPALRSFCDDSAQAPDARVCDAALGRLGLPQAQQRFGEGLLAKPDPEGLELATYINQPWLLPYLAVLLRNTDPVQSLGDPPPGFPKVLRVCDRAMALIGPLTGGRLSFSTAQHQNYTPAQLAEAANVANSLR